MLDWWSYSNAIDGVEGVPIYSRNVEVKSMVSDVVILEICHGQPVI